MSVMFLLLPLALLFAGAALCVFVWAALSGQYDDLDTPAVRILHEDDSTDRPRQENGARGPAA